MGHSSLILIIVGGVAVAENKFVSSNFMKWLLLYLWRPWIVFHKNAVCVPHISLVSDEMIWDGHQTGKFKSF